MFIMRSMKSFIIILFSALLTVACTSTKNASKTSAIVEPVSQDSTEYELVIIDNHFDQWYMLHYSEARDRTEEYYHSKNQVAVQNWNDYYRHGRYIDIIDSYINYQPQIDYGVELNRKLYWYFKYVEDYYGVKLYY
jgi:hypothetical protein